MNYPALATRLAYRNVSAVRRTMPQVYLLGATRCGTTLMYELFKKHPNFIPPFIDTRQLFFLQDLPNFKAHDFTGIVKVLYDMLYGRYNGAASYRKFFPLKGEMNAIEKSTGCKAITGDFTSIYLYCREAAQRIRAITPDARLIIMLRDPVKRAYSEYCFMVTRTSLEKRSFEAAVADELNNRGKGNYFIDNYVRKGIYEPHVRIYNELFNKEQIMVIRSEDFFADPVNLANKVLAFTGLPPVKIDGDLNDLQRNGNFYVKRLKDDTRAMLKEYYRPHNQKLFEYLGVDMQWDQ